MRRLVVLTAVFSFLAAATPADGATLSRCGSTYDCLCISWNSGFEIRCPIGPDPFDTTVARNPNPEPGRNPGAGPRGSGGGHPGTSFLADQTFKLNAAKRKALKRGALSPLKPLKDPDYEPTDCMMLFAGLEVSHSGKWLLNNFIIFRNGEGVSSGSEVPCSAGNSAWTVSPGSRYPYVFLCDSFFNLTQAQAARKLVHEALHVAGQFELTAGITPAEIDGLVSSSCSGF